MRSELPRSLPILLLALAAGCATGQPGPGISGTLVQAAECEVVAEGSAPIRGTGRLHILGNNQRERGYLALACANRGEGYSRNLLLVFNVGAERGTIPDGTYPIVRGGGQGQGTVATLLYYAPPVYLAGSGGTVAIQRDSAGRLLARVHATTVRRRRPM
jgi:hypothetical protein